MAAGAVAALAGRPVDAVIRATSAAAHAVASSEADARRLIFFADVLAFGGLELACAQLGLDPVTAV